MGCCTSRPSGEPDEGHDAARPTVTSHLQTPPPVFRSESGIRPASSSNSVATSTEHQAVALNEHYNEPLRSHMWRTKSRRRPWTRAKWQAKREEFFHTRVTNRAEIWESLKAVVELLDHGEIETAQGILNASEITLPTGDLVDGAYDSLGNLYQMPPYAVSAPDNMVETEDEAAAALAAAGAASAAAKTGAAADATSQPASPTTEKEKGKMVAKMVESISVKARLSDPGTDVLVQIGKDDTVKALVQAVAEKASVAPEKIKIAYMGRVLKPNKGFVAQGWQQGHVVNALVLP